MSKEIFNLIQNLESDNALDAETNFNAIISQKVVSALESRKKDIASSMLKSENVDYDMDELNELSKQTLGSYFGKASVDNVANTIKVAKCTPGADLAKHKIGNRIGGINNTLNRLTQENAESMGLSLTEEELDEISKQTLASYIKKASSSSNERSASNLASRAAYKLANSKDIEGEDDGELEDAKSFMRSKGISSALDKILKK